MIENNSPPETVKLEIQSQSTNGTNGNGNESEIIFTGSPYCFHMDDKNACRNRSVPGSSLCGPHGGKLTLRQDRTLGIIGPGAYRAIAQLANLNNRYVSQVLQGKANPTSSVLDRIAKVVGISVERLVGYIEEQKDNNQ